MKMKPMVNFTISVVLGLLTMALAFLTYSAGRGNCPQCGHTRDLHACKHCDWTACLECWQRMSKHSTCPNPKGCSYSHFPPIEFCKS